MPRIRVLKPNVTKEQALRYFTSGLWNASIGRLRGRVQSIAEIYIPYRLFEVTISNSGRRENSIFALDAVHGVLDLYRFSSAPSDTETLTLETRNVVSPTQPTSTDAEKVVAKVRRQIFAKGFFKVRDLQLEAKPIPGEVCIPYWVCFRGTNSSLNFLVLDAVRRQVEGAKVRQLVEEWLHSQ